MRILRGFHIKKHLASIIPRSCRRRKHKYIRLDSSESSNKSSSLCDWVKHKALKICSINSYRRVKEEMEKSEPVPKGFLAVYVDESRVLVPVVYFNHPLFGELLKEAEDVFGYEHSGGIKLPCPISEFEKVQTTIKSGCCGRGRGRKKLL